MSELLKQPRDQHPYSPQSPTHGVPLAPPRPCPSSTTTWSHRSRRYYLYFRLRADVKRYSKLATVDAELTALYIVPRRKYRQ